VGELWVCPYCVGLWIASGLTGTLIVAPRLARWISFTLTAVTISDFLQVAYKKAEDAL
jgi:Na+/proline symporter